jgi:hypothetical protein
MNKKLFYIAMTLVLLVSCEKNQVIPIEEYLSLQKKSITVPTEGGHLMLNTKQSQMSHSQFLKIPNGLSLRPMEVQKTHHLTTPED